MRSADIRGQSAEAVMPAHVVDLCSGALVVVVVAERLG
jgi:hypothetical protein